MNTYEQILDIAVQNRDATEIKIILGDKEIRSKLSDEYLKDFMLNVIQRAKNDLFSQCIEALNLRELVYDEIELRKKNISDY